MTQEGIARLEERLAALDRRVDDAIRVRKDAMAEMDRRVTEENAGRNKSVDEALKQSTEHLTAAVRMLEEQINQRAAEIRDTRLLLGQLEERTLPREYYDERHSSLELRIGRLERQIANWQGRAIGIGFVGALGVAVVTAVVTHLVSGG